MRIDEIVINFPTKARVTQQGKAAKSNVVGKLPSGHLVYTDEITGHPYIKNRNGVVFDVEPNAQSLPKDYDDNRTHPEEWLLINPATSGAHAVYSSRKKAELAKRKFKQWKGLDLEIQQLR